jgi:hypothetical protein
VIKTEIMAPNALKVVPTGRLTEDDFDQLAARVDPMIRQSGQIRLLIDASEFAGWVNFRAFRTHMRFIGDHQRQVERLAAIVAHRWQHRLVSVVGVFVHPEVRAFDTSHGCDAVRWIVGT